MPSEDSKQGGLPPKRSSVVGGSLSIAVRLRELRLAAALSQEALGAQGFISTPGWIKIENGQRSPSEKLLAALAAFLVGEKVIRANQKDVLFEELCALKYATHRGQFLARLAKHHLRKLVPVAIFPISSAGLRDGSVVKDARGRSEQRLGG